MRKTLRNICVAGAMAWFCLCWLSQAEAKVKLPALLSDGMVLQRNSPVCVWGTADAGEAIIVRFQKKRYSAIADGNGRWSVVLPPMKAGGPYQMEVNDVVLHDILIGDVWLCSGQSNMELPVSRVVDMFASEIESYANEKIRHVIVPKRYNFHAPQEELSPVCWKALNRENVSEFSAVAYFFAKEMYERTGIPVGLINASWGGTPVEAWISEEGLREFPIYVNEKRLYEDDAYCMHIKKLENENFGRWNRTLYLGDTGLHEPMPWYADDYDDSLWTAVDMFARSWGNNGLNPVGGSHWLRKEVSVPTAWEGHEAVLRLGCIVDADSVYVNGTFVGTTGYQYPPRIYTVPAGVLRAGKNTVTVRIVSNGGQPHFVPEKPYKIICRPDSGQLEEISLEGEWRYRLGAPMPKAPDMMFFCYKPVGLYNAMIAPLQRCAVRGALWYQGESNVSRRNEYADLLTAMIADWRQTFAQPDMPFYIVELADFLHPDDVYGRQAWAEMRAEQAKAAERNHHAWLVKNGDLGEWNDIHPLDKKTLGIRIADKVMQTLGK